MSTTTITGTSETPAGAVRFGTLVRAHVVYGSVGIDDDDGNVLEDRTSSAKDGTWSLNLRPNSELDPIGSWYRIRIGDRVVTKLVPAGGGTYDIDDPALAFTPSAGVELVANLVDYQTLAQRNAASGYMGLDSSGRAAWAQLPASVLTTVTKLANIIYAVDYGVVGDGTDESTVVQAVFNAVTGASAGVPAATIIWPPGTIACSNIQVNRKAVTSRGQGIGNPTLYTGNPGKGTTFQYNGSAGGVMFHLEDCTHVSFEDMLVQGHPTNVPAALFEFTSAGGGSGINALCRFNRVHFGRWPWSNVVINASTSCATAAVIYNGTNANNDKSIFRDCRFDCVGIGLSLPNSQSEWGVMDNCYFVQCQTAGVSTSANLTLFNARFQQCVADFLIASTAHVDVYGHWSENSAAPVTLTGQGYYACHGGQILASASLGTNIIDHQSCGADGGVYLAGWRYNANGQTGKKIKVRGAGGAATMGGLTILDAPGVTRDMLDVQAASAGAGFRVNIKSWDLSYDCILKSSQNLLTSTRATSVGGRGLTSPLHRGYAAEAYDATAVGTGVIVPTAGTVYGIRLWLPTAESLSELRLWIVTAGATLTASQNLAALYSGAGALLATSADQSTAWTATGECTMAISAQTPSAGPVFLCFFYNGTTAPTFLALNTGTGNRGLAAADSFFFRTSDTGRTTTMPSTLGTFTAITPAYWGAIK